MAAFFYTTIENQLREDGSRGLLYDHFEDLALAEHKYFTVCAAAAISGIPYHSAHLLRSDGYMEAMKVYDRRVDPQPEPEPEPTPDEGGDEGSEGDVTPEEEVIPE